ncbi:MAG: hypothetical protein KDB80_05040, partial [Planctomycetes bacterium]|nr:hypothetical protein [Planctomycetota bacterium]
MRRVHGLLLLGLLGLLGCSTTTPVVVARVVETRSMDSVPPELARWVADLDTADPSRAERGLRNLVAEGGDVGAAAAVALAEHLASIEDHAGAVAVVDAAIRSAGDRPALAQCDARLLADVGRFDEAAERLRVFLTAESRPHELLADL